MAEGTVPTLGGMHNVRMDIDQETQKNTPIVKAEIIDIVDGANVTFGSMDDIPAPDDTGTYTFMAFVKRLLVRLSALLPEALTGNGNFMVSLEETNTALPVVGNAASGSTIVGPPVPVAGVDWDGNVQPIRVDEIGAQYTALVNSGGVHIYENRILAPLGLTSRTATPVLAPHTNAFWKGLLLVIEVTVVGTGSITPSITLTVTPSGAPHTIWTAAAPIVANGVYKYLFYPGAVGAGYTEVVQIPMSHAYWGLVVTHNNANPITYGAVYHYMF